MYKKQKNEAPKSESGGRREAGKPYKTRDTRPNISAAVSHKGVQQNSSCLWHLPELCTGTSIIMYIGQYYII